ncbi:hypothetical protein BD324DRAFT_616997 [Kockovaella imperatae]|uniref:Uncharacterized protein n=1 Tax=Kockovaella imperatae TaxID=4999 RepID=A0A1Y1UQA1_9TREE|nr:hypothetical protein BD324DRAFT_616997 [Kockovaella imperatae]ORX40240.1 hypothetical protein BD324DRAFT_616997 [Kockovaella imperatae]
MDHLPSLTFSSGQLAVSSNFWPISQPTPDVPWIINGTNYVSWICGGASGIPSFDIQLLNHNKSIMVGFIPIALRVPMARLPTGQKNFGGELQIELGEDIPTGDGFSLVFLSSLHGQVYAKSKPFSILPAAPSNYTEPVLPTATVTAILDTLPNPTQQWALTLNGIDPDALETQAAAIAGNVGSH